MDSLKFDKFTRLFATSPSRRSVVKGVAGLAVGGAVVAQAVEPAAACVKVNDNNNNNRQCNNDNDCCGDKDSVKCRNKKCVCRSGFRECDNKCVDRRTDSKNCGRCGKKCNGRNSNCVNGSCSNEGVCVGVGIRCGDGYGDCCSGLACNAGNDAFRVCGLAGGF